jgi:hypothetical protein
MLALRHAAQGFYTAPLKLCATLEGFCDAPQGFYIAMQSLYCAT